MLADYFLQCKERTERFEVGESGAADFASFTRNGKKGQR
jgi:hypothetical protein